MFDYKDISKEHLNAHIDHIKWMNNMKKILFLIAVLFTMISCSEQRPDTNVYHKVEKTNDVYRVYDDLNVRVVIIDSCEYLIGSRQYGSYQGYGYLSHKGNCKYCAERRRRELKNSK